MERASGILGNWFNFELDPCMALYS